MAWMKLNTVAPALPTQGPRAPGAVAFLVPLVAFAALQALAHSEVDAAASAETSFLAFLLAGALVAIATASRRPAVELSWTALLVLTTAWIVDYGPHRTAVVAVLLLGGLVMTLRRWWGTPAEGLPLRVPLATIFGLQLLVRPELALAPRAGTLLDLLLVPLLSGWALHRIGRSAGGHRMLLAAVASGVFLPGWNLALALVLTTVAMSVGGRGSPYRVLLVPALLLFWNPLAALLLGLAVAVLLVRRRRAGGLAALLVLAVAVAGWQAAGQVGAAIETWSLGLLVLPGIALVERSQRWRASNGALLALLIALLDPMAVLPPGLIAAGWIVVALALARRGVGAEWQRSWGVLCGLWTVLLAACPWRRTEPLVWLAEQLSLTVLASALWAVGLLLLVVALSRLARRAAARLPAWSMLLVLAVVGVLLIPTTVALPVSYQAVRLDDERPRWSRAFEVVDTGSLVIDSHLIHGVELPAGTPVARIELRAPGGQVVETRFLRAGEDTAEWAAARPDLAALPGLTTPPAWLSQVALDRTFFAQRYRASWHLAARSDVERVTLWRHTELPEEVVLMVYRMELRR